jgi:hypothetical protein
LKSPSGLQVFKDECRIMVVEKVGGIGVVVSGIKEEKKDS